MQIVIDVPKEKYDLCKKWKPSERSELQEAVANGTPLPKGHGRLIDADDLIQELSVVSSRPIKSQLYILREAPTIIEAESEEEA